MKILTLIQSRYRIFPLLHVFPMSFYGQILFPSVLNTSSAPVKQQCGLLFHNLVISKMLCRWSPVKMAK